MPQVTGLLKKVNVKSGKSARGPWTAYSIGIDSDGSDSLTWYGCGFDKPDASEGSFVTFKAEEDAKGYLKVSGPISIEKNATAPAAKAYSAGADTRTDSIIRQNSTGHAVAMATAMVEHGLVNVPKAVNARYDFFIGLVDELTDHIFVKSREPKSVDDILNGVEPDPEDLSPEPDDDDDYNPV